MRYFAKISFRVGWSTTPHLMLSPQSLPSWVTTAWGDEASFQQVFGFSSEWWDEVELRPHPVCAGQNCPSNGMYIEIKSDNGSQMEVVTGDIFIWACRLLLLMMGSFASAALQVPVARILTYDTEKVPSSCRSSLHDWNV